MIHRSARIVASLLKRSEVWVLVGWDIEKTSFKRKPAETCFSNEGRYFTMEEMFNRLNDCQQSSPLDVYLRHSKLTPEEQSYYIKHINTPESCIAALLDEDYTLSIVAFEKRFYRMSGVRRIVITQACISEKIAETYAKRLPNDIRYEIVRIEQ